MGDTRNDNRLNFSDLSNRVFITPTNGIPRVPKDAREERDDNNRHLSILNSQRPTEFFQRRKKNDQSTEKPNENEVAA